MKIDEFKKSLADRDLIGLDSEFTKTTRSLVEKYCASGAHLNRWWVMTPVNWRCPVCDREKRQIVRLNNRNYLICHLHSHHDHMDELTKTLFEKYSEEKETVVADELSSRFASRAASTLAAFDETIICFDCNSADAEAKSITEAHPNFSFSPQEISTFIEVSSNQPHRINPVEARKTWNAAQETFNIRMHFAKQLASVAANKKDWFQPTESTTDKVVRSAKLAYKINKLLEIDQYNPETLLYTPSPFSSASSSWRKKTSKATPIPPSASEIEHLIATRGDYWCQYDDHWTCPCCQRSKLNCIRRSNKKAWTLEIKSTSLFDEASQSPNYNSPKICIDCMNAAIHLGREVVEQTGAEIEYSSSVISIDDLKRVISARPHSKHLFDNKLIETLMPTWCVRSNIIEALEIQRLEELRNERNGFYTIEAPLIENICTESIQEFLNDISSGAPASTALQELIFTENLSSLDSSVILDLLKRAYPNIDISVISGVIHDSGYPFCTPLDFDHAQFDNLIKDACESTSDW